VITLIAGNEATYKPFGDIYRGCKAIVARYGATFRSIDTQAESDLSVLERQQREHDALQQLLASPVSGVIIWCQFPQLSLPLLQRLRDAGTAVVAIDRELPGGQFDYVGSNNRRGAEQAVEYLCQKGHRRIAFVTPVDDEVSTVFDREEGFLRAVYRRQDSVRGSVLRLPFRASDDEIFTALRPLMSSIDPPTGIFAMNDFYAQGVVRALRTAGTRVPQEVAVVGFDDIETPLGLTTIHQPFQEIGEAAVRRILMRLHYPDAAVCQLLLSTRLMERDTT
jgi:DNA-binding LacI/PurR family transcriptional regulator